MVIPLTKDGSLGIVQPKPESLQTREIKNKKKIVLIVRHLFANQIRHACMHWSVSGIPEILTGVHVHLSKPSTPKSLKPTKT
jgi:hypothetical protein